MRFLWTTLVLLAMLAGSAPAEIIDRVVAVVGNQAVTTSDVDRQIRLEAMLNREPLQLNPEKRKEALERLITLRVVQSEPMMAGFLRISEDEARKRVDQAKQENYWNSAGFEEALKIYGLDERDVLEFWRQVMGLERFKDFRFKTGREVTPEEVAAYYQQQILPEFKSGNRGNPPPLAELYSQIEQAVLEERANAALEEWVKETRPQLRVVVFEDQNVQPTKREAPVEASSPADGALSDGQNGQ